MNIYLLIAGGAGSGVVAFLSSNNDNTKAELQLAAVALLWLVYLIGWLTLFKLIALRRAWGNSAIAMNYIKEFYIDYAKDMGLPDGYLDSAFFWKATTIPPPHAHWNVFHYSNLLIALLDAAALVAGAMLVDIYLKGTAVYIITVTGCLLAMALIMAHWWTYDIALTPR